jgi:hypothetical protein
MRTNSHIRKDVKQSQPNDNEDYLQQRYREFAEITSTIKIVDDIIFHLSRYLLTIYISPILF